MLDPGKALCYGVYLFDRTCVNRIYGYSSWENALMKGYQISSALFKKAKEMIPGGVNSPVRACRAVGMDPVFIRSGNGATITDADGNAYIDYVGSWGPMILGHAHPAVRQGDRRRLESRDQFRRPDGS